jgi:hypothetical protein
LNAPQNRPALPPADTSATFCADRGRLPLLIGKSSPQVRLGSSLGVSFRMRKAYYYQYGHVLLSAENVPNMVRFLHSKPSERRR